MSMNRQPPLDPGEESSLAPLTQMAVELKKTPAEALSRLMAEELSAEKAAESSSAREIDSCTKTALIDSTSTEKLSQFCLKFEWAILGSNQ